MRKSRHHIIQFGCILAVLTAIMLQGFTKVVKLKPLSGFEKEERPPVALKFKTYYDGSYQNYMTEHAKRNTGFREFFIRNYNQVCYTCFDKITNNRVFKGYDNELFLDMYLNEVTGKQLRQEYGSVEEAQRDARKNVEATLALIDTLRQHGTEFLFVFAPSKTAVYPEKMPQSYQDRLLDFSLEECYIELFKENGIPHIDFYHYFQGLKDTATYPLYTRTGTHWAESTIPFVSDSIFKKLEAQTGFRLPSVAIVNDNVSTEYSTIDSELEANLNLLFPLPKPALPNPEFTLEDTIGKDRPNLLVIADSYFNQLRRSCFVDAFNQWDYWVYNREVQSSREKYNWKQLNMILDADQVLEEADIVMAVFTAPMFYNYMFGFTHTALELLHHGTMSDEEALQTIIKKIMNDPAWMKAIEEQAERLGISVEENIRSNADYTLRSLKQTNAQP